ncbi:hypothetical protein LSAT2_007941 [Lamellibrachia satsuma]|nr:hypothetical protein LSAT2_007941 [Lamellibrachia satsuma]
MAGEEDTLKCQVWFEPTDIRLAGKPFESDAWRHLAYASPNLNELRVMHARIAGADVIVDKASSVDGRASDTIDECLVLVSSLLRHIPNIVVTLGKHGVLLCRRGVSASSLFPIRGDLPVTVSSRKSKDPPVVTCASLVRYTINHNEE